MRVPHARHERPALRQMRLSVCVKPHRLLRLQEIGGGDGFARVRDRIREAINERPVKCVAAAKPVLGIFGAYNPVNEPGGSRCEAYLFAVLSMLVVLGPVVVGGWIAVIVVKTMIREVVKISDRSQCQATEIRSQRRDSSVTEFALVQRQTADPYQRATWRAVKQTCGLKGLRRDQRLDVRGRR